MSFEEEKELLKKFDKAVQNGQVAEVSNILRAYEEKPGRSFEKDPGKLFSCNSKRISQIISPSSAMKQTYFYGYFYLDFTRKTTYD